MFHTDALWRVDPAFGTESIGMADDFQVLIESLGRTSVGYLKNSAAEGIRILPNEESSSALMVVRLREDTWANRLEAADALRPVREMFRDELALEFSFESADESRPELSRSDREIRETVPA